MKKYPGVHAHGKGYRGKVYVGIVDGKKRYEYTDVFKLASEAADERNELKGRLSGSRAAKGRVTVKAFQETWLDVKPRGNSTNVTYAAQTKPFAAEHGALRMRDVDEDLALAWALGNRWTVNGLRAMFTDAVDRRVVPSNPFAGLRLKQSKGRADIVVLSEDEVLALADCALKVWGAYGAMWRTMILLSAYVGARPGELLAWRFQDFDLADESVLIERQLSHHTGEFTLPKNKKVRTVTVGGPALEAVRSMPIPLDRSRELFRTKKDRLFKGNSFNYYWGPIRAAFGRPDLDYYELRHFCGSHLLNTHELPAQDVAQQLGHTDNGTLVLKLYGHPSPDLARTRIKRALRGNVVEMASERVPKESQGS